MEPEVETGFDPVYASLQAAASPLGHSTVKAVYLRADDEARTRDLNLGKVALYQLSYVRRCTVWGGKPQLVRDQTLADGPEPVQTGPGPSHGVSWSSHRCQSCRTAPATALRRTPTGSSHELAKRSFSASMS